MICSASSLSRARNSCNLSSMTFRLVTYSNGSKMPHSRSFCLLGFLEATYSGLYVFTVPYLSGYARIKTARSTSRHTMATSASPREVPPDAPARRPSLLQPDVDFSLVLGGPLFQLFRKAHLTGDTLELLHRRILIIPLIAWLPWQVSPSSATGLPGGFHGRSFAVE